DTTAHQIELLLLAAVRIVRTERRVAIWEDRARGIVHVLRPEPQFGGVVHIELPMEWAVDHMPVGIRQLLQGGSKVSRSCLCCSRPFTSAGAHNRVCSTCKSSEGSAWAAA